MSGVQAGAHDVAFYAAYVYFEKIRQKEGKKKTKKRERMEEIWDKKSNPDFRRIGMSREVSLVDSRGWEGIWRR